MNIQTLLPEQHDAVVALFTAVFGESEGLDEGRQIGRLVNNILTTTAPDDLFCLVAMADSDLIGGVLYSRMRLTSPMSAFILSPLAIATQSQGKGVGTALVRAGLQRLNDMQIDWVFTYGDPGYYGRLGFNHIDDKHFRPPFALSFPHGWLGRPVAAATNDNLPPASATCIPALSDERFW